MDRRQLLFIVTTLLCVNVAADAHESALKSIKSDNNNRLPDSRQYKLTHEAQLKVGQFAKTLKTALVTAIKEKGFAHAVSVCEKEAPLIAQSLSVDGWTVARTTLKPRNPLNVADEWERLQLREFDKQYSAGTPVKTINVSKLEEKRFRYMQAIPTAQVCLACHGQQIDPALLASINTIYPNDKAVGFTLEDLRGAFTLSKKVEE